MTVLFGLLLALAVILLVVGGVLFLVAAFRTSAGWGLAVLFIPLAALVFLVKYWPQARQAFLTQVAGTALLLGAMAMFVFTGASNLQAMRAKLPVHMVPPGVLRIPGEAVPGAEAVEPEKTPAPTNVVAQDVRPDPASGPRQLIGKPISEVRRMLGEPKGSLQSARKATLIYADLTVYSDDGQIVSDVVASSTYKTTLPPKKPAAHRTATPGATAAGAKPAAPATGPVQKIMVVGSNGQKLDLAGVLVPGQTTVVDFFADWCGPCREMTPLLEQFVRQETNVVLRKVDIVNWNTPVVRQYEIRSVPNVRVYNASGKAVGSPSHSYQEIIANVTKAKNAGR